jgi:hypothetical protein
MKRIGRLIFNALTVLSLLLGILVAAAWGRGEDKSAITPER